MALLARDDSRWLSVRSSRWGRVAGTCVALLCAVGCGSDDDDPPADAETVRAQLTPEEESNIDVATRVIEDGLAGGDTAVINELVRPDYIQHNAGAPDGRDGLLGFIAFLQSQGGTAVTIHRKLASGDYVALHSTYGSGDARQVAFDVFRLEGGQLAEHWDALQDWVDPSATANGNSMVDGETTVTDRSATQANAELVTRLVRQVFILGQVETLGDYIGDTYVQHNPLADNGLAGVQAFFASTAAQGIQVGYTASPIVVADGNFVLVGSEGFLGAMDDYTVFYDLFRVDAGKVVEHWDVIQPIDLAAVPHQNGLFGQGTAAR